ncbi:hypothetical protein [Pseudomonas sp. ICMP 561]|uniref:hypothetical protein n=1 Tax=Pseudomonas sp. ICMP 561 TaxID=1718918 RepID=UPI000C06AAC9|nr:hypothetical protein [Pseudomonas sp. ICMP 561]PHN31624.1 hypothetical protein AO242_15235 [Pseudomonas sp. ICMP 561]
MHTHETSAVPAITGVVDSEDHPIPNNGTTEDTVLTLLGVGTVNIGVIIADNDTPIALALVNENGEWMKSVAAQEGRHSYTVRFSDDAWVVTVVMAAQAPTIISVRDSQGEVVDGGSTFDQRVTLEGTAAADQWVEILDRAEIIASVLATGGRWAVDLPLLAFKGYSLKARGLYGSIPESDVRAFNVIYRGEDFETGALGAIPANIALEFPAMFVTPNKDASLIDDSVAAPFVTGKAISIAEDSVVRFDLKSPVNKITFGAFAMADGFGVEPPYLSCFDESQALIFERKLYFGEDYAVWDEVVSPDRRITSLVLTVHVRTTAFHVDNFSFF